MVYMSKIKKKTQIELIWSLMGGLLFSMMPRLFYGNGSTFNLETWVAHDLDRFGNRGSLDELVFGFVVTFLLIWSIKQYRSL